MSTTKHKPAGRKPQRTPLDSLNSRHVVGRLRAFYFAHGAEAARELYNKISGGRMPRELSKAERKAVWLACDAIDGINHAEKPTE